MWLRNCWYVACWSHELGPNDIIARTIIDQPLVLYRRRDGSVVALEDRCCHRLAPLSKGRREADDLRCMYHGLKFAPDGSCIEIPGQASIPAKARVRAFEAGESGSWIWIWMGDAGQADRGLIPSSVSLDDEAWHLRAGSLDYATDFQLINDNLLDLTHLSFVHEATLGRGMPQWGDERPRLSRLERGVRSQRWIRNVDSSHFLGHLGQRFDLWHSYDFLVPGIFLQRTSFHPGGTAERSGGAAPADEPLFVRLDEHAVTPVGARRAAYFYSVGARRRDGAPSLIDRLNQHATRAFIEDKEIIEAQQLRVDLDPARPMIATNSDVGPNLFRGLLRSMIEGENRVASAAAGD